jgi:hypothetical protein
MYRSLTSSVLLADRPSQYSEQLLTRLGLEERFDEGGRRQVGTGRVAVGRHMSQHTVGSQKTVRWRWVMKSGPQEPQATKPDRMPSQQGGTLR